MALEISSEITDIKAIIRIEGEVDVSNASELRDAGYCARRWSKKLKLDLLR